MRNLAVTLVVAATIVVTLAGCSAGEKPLLDTQPTILSSEDGDILSSLHATMSGPAVVAGISGVGAYAPEHALMIPKLTPGSCANSIWPLILLDRDVNDKTGEIETGEDVVIDTKHVSQLVRTFVTVQQARDFLAASETALAACPKYTVASKTHITQKVIGATDGGYALDTVASGDGEKILATHRLVIRDANVIYSVSGAPTAPVATVARAIQKRIEG